MAWYNVQWSFRTPRHSKLTHVFNPDFEDFKRPKGVRGTSGLSVDIDIWFLRIVLCIDALIINLFQGVHDTPFFRLEYMYVNPTFYKVANNLISILCIVPQLV